MSIYYVNQQIGDDNFDGSEPTVTGDGSGPWATAFQAVCHAQPGDTIRLAAGSYNSGGNHQHLQNVSSIYYDITDNTLSHPTAFQTYQHRAGDHIRIRSDNFAVQNGVYEIAGKVNETTIQLASSIALESVYVDMDSLSHIDVVTAGSDTDPVTVEGIGGSAVLEGLEHGISTDLSGALFYVFKNIHIKEPAKEGVNFAYADRSIFRNCHVEVAGDVTTYSGFKVNDHCAFYECGARACSIGFDMNASCLVVGCTADNCSSFGFDGEFMAAVQNCTARNCHNGIRCLYGNIHFCVTHNCGIGIETYTFQGIHNISNCTVVGDGSAESTGIHCHSMHGSVINCIVHNCFSCLQDNVDYTALRFARNNILNPIAGETAACNWPVGEGTIISQDPGFRDAAGGDFRLRWNSPARRAGWPSWLDIGAAQRKEPWWFQGIRHGGRS
jgi:hypothetical protein